jgi:hypothetical protein
MDISRIQKKLWKNIKKITQTIGSKSLEILTILWMSHKMIPKTNKSYIFSTFSDIY